jgi:hypothetical protein
MPTAYDISGRYHSLPCVQKPAAECEELVLELLADLVFESSILTPEIKSYNPLQAAPEGARRALVEKRCTYLDRVSWMVMKRQRRIVELV